MKDKSLLQKLNKLGYPLLITEEDLSVHETFSALAKSKDIRLWEGFPLLLANAYERGLLNHEDVSELLKNVQAKASFKELILLALSFYKVLKLKFLWADKLYKTLSLKDMKRTEKFLEHFKKDQDIVISSLRLSPQRIKEIFNIYFKKKESEARSLTSKQEELSLEYALSKIFSPKQKELFFKKIRGEKLSKTEREYFSRVIKKKVIALASPELHRLAQGLLKI
ncbi:MAG: hypothetical protein ABID83_05340 [Candidatus Omnitrophota bacterium]